MAEFARGTVLCGHAGARTVPSRLMLPLLARPNRPPTHHAKCTTPHHKPPTPHLDASGSLDTSPNTSPNAPSNSAGRRPSVNSDSVRVVKLMGGNVNLSEVVHGMVFPRAAETVIKSVTDAKVTVFGCGIESESTETAGTVLIRNADDMLNYNKSEEKVRHEKGMCFEFGGLKGGREGGREGGHAQTARRDG